jgi:hypothetical protein
LLLVVFNQFFVISTDWQGDCIFHYRALAFDVQKAKRGMAQQEV